MFAYTLHLPLHSICICLRIHFVFVSTYNLYLSLHTICICLRMAPHALCICVCIQFVVVSAYNLYLCVCAGGSREVRYESNSPNSLQSLLPLSLYLAQPSLAPSPSPSPSPSPLHHCTGVANSHLYGKKPSLLPSSLYLSQHHHCLHHHHHRCTNTITTTNQH